MVQTSLPTSITPATFLPGVISTNGTVGHDTDHLDLHRRYNEGWISITDHGAVGDGSTDDTSAIQSAIDAVATDGGGVVFFPSGNTYRLASNLTLNAQTDVALVGAGWESTVISCDAGFLVATNSSNHGSVIGLKIKCSTDPNTDDGIDVDIARRWTVKRCKIEDFGGNSIIFRAGNASRIVHNLIRAQDSSGTNGNAGISLTTSGSTPGTTAHVESNYIIVGNTYGIYNSKYTHSVFLNNIVESVTTGLRFETASGGQIYNPYFESISGNEIELVDSIVPVIGGRSANVTATWSAVASANRYIMQLTRQDITARQITAEDDLLHTGNLFGVFGSSNAQAAAYTPTNVSTDRAFDADTVLVAELADVVGTLIADLQTYGLLQ